MVFSRSRLFAALLLAPAAGPALGQHVTRIQLGAGELKGLRAQVSADRLAWKAVGSAAPLMTAGTRLDRISTHTGAGGLAGDLARMTVGPELARLGGGVRQTGKALFRLPPLGRDLAGGTGTLDRVVSPDALARLQDEYNRLGAGKVESQPPQPLATAMLKSGVEVGNGWVLTFLSSGNFTVVNQNNGEGFLVHDDPHLSKVTESAKKGTHYGDWESACVLKELPGADATFPTFLLCFSTGGTTGNAFGYATEVVVLTKDRFLHLKGLNTDAPTGVAGDGALFAYRAYKDDAASAKRLRWDAQHGELRTPSGHRPNPSDAAKDYTRSGPATPVRLETLYGDGYSLADKVRNAPADLPAADRELFARFAHALGAAECKNERIAAEADRFRKSAVTYGTAQSAYLLERGKLIAELQALLKEIKELDDTLTSSLTTPAQKEAARKKLDDLARRSAELDDKLTALDGKRK